MPLPDAMSGLDALQPLDLSFTSPSERRLGPPPAPARPSAARRRGHAPSADRVVGPHEIRLETADVGRGLLSPDRHRTRRVRTAPRFGGLNQTVRVGGVRGLAG